MNKIWIVDLEAVESRYTGEWKTHIPQLLEIESLIHDKYSIKIYESIIKYSNYDSWILACR